MIDFYELYQSLTLFNLCKHYPLAIFPTYNIEITNHHMTKRPRHSGGVAQSYQFSLNSPGFESPSQQSYVQCMKIPFVS